MSITSRLTKLTHSRLFSLLILISLVVGLWSIRPRVNPVKATSPCGQGVSGYCDGETLYCPDGSIPTRQVWCAGSDSVTCSGRTHCPNGCDDATGQCRPNDAPSCSVTPSLGGGCTDPRSSSASITISNCGANQARMTNICFYDEEYYNHYGCSCGGEYNDQTHPVPECPPGKSDAELIGTNCRKSTFTTGEGTSSINCPYCTVGQIDGVCGGSGGYSGANCYAFCNTWEPDCVPDNLELGGRFYCQDPNGPIYPIQNAQAVISKYIDGYTPDPSNADGYYQYSIPASNEPEYRISHNKTDGLPANGVLSNGQPYSEMIGPQLNQNTNCQLNQTHSGDWQYTCTPDNFPANNLDFIYSNCEPEGSATLQATCEPPVQDWVDDLPNAGPVYRMTLSEISPTVNFDSATFSLCFNHQTLSSIQTTAIKDFLSTPSWCSTGDVNNCTSGTFCYDIQQTTNLTNNQASFLWSKTHTFANSKTVSDLAYQTQIWMDSGIFNPDFRYWLSANFKANGETYTGNSITNQDLLLDITPNACATAPGPQCHEIAAFRFDSETGNTRNLNPDQIEKDDNLIFACSGAISSQSGTTYTDELPNGYYFGFAILTPDSNWERIPVSTDDAGNLPNRPDLSSPILIDNTGDYQVQCAVCNNNSGQENCDWEVEPNF